MSQLYSCMSQLYSCMSQRYSFMLQPYSCIFQSAGIGGCAHLVNFMGTDTIAGIMTARDYYGCPIAGFSIPAAEHRYVSIYRILHELSFNVNFYETRLLFRERLENFISGTIF